MYAKNKVGLPFQDIIYWINDEKIESFFLLHQFFGTLPYRVNCGKLITKNKLHFWNIFVTCILIVFSLSFIFYIPPFLQGSLILLIVNGGQMALMILHVIFFSINVKIKKHKLDKYLYYIRTTGNSTFGHSNTITIVLVIICQTGLVLFILTAYKVFMDNINIYLIYYTTVVMSVTIVGQFSGILTSIKHRFILLTKSLNGSDPYKFVDSLRKYEQLMTICEEVNDVYAFPIIFIFLFSFIVLTTGCYSALGKESPLNALMYFLWSIIIWMTPFRLTFTCSQVMFQVNKFNQKLSILIGNTRNLHTSVKVKAHIHFTRKQKLVFTASKFFNIDFPFVGKMCMQEVTYLILLIQLNGVISLY